jgi:hypothetical protein
MGQYYVAGHLISNLFQSISPAKNSLSAAFAAPDASVRDAKTMEGAQRQ